MVDIDPKISCYHIKIDPKAAPHNEGHQPRKARGLMDEVKKLINNHSIREATYSKWVLNPVLVKRHSEKRIVFIDFSNLNQTYPEDGFFFYE